MSTAPTHPSDQIVATLERTYAQDMTTASGGNISIRGENGEIWITPTRIDKGNLRRQDIIRITADGKPDGIHRPTNELSFHQGIYKARPDVNAIIHAYPCALASFSICGRVPDTRVFPEAWKFCGKVGFASYARPGSIHLADKIVAEFASLERPNCVLLENHGIVIVAKDIDTAYQRFEMLEVTAQAILNASSLGEVRYLDDARLALSHLKPNELREHAPMLPSPRETELRKELAGMVHRACVHRLMTGTKGSFSARLDGDTILMTPFQVDRQTLSPDDFVVVRSDTCSEGQIPSRAVKMHQAIYRAHPQIHAVVNAMPVHSAAFCVSGFELDPRTIPQSYLTLKDVQKIPFDFQYQDCDKIAKIVTPANPVSLLEHNGVLVAGRTVLDAFDRLEVLESTAAAIFRSRALGPIKPMPDAAIRDLLINFMDRSVIQHCWNR